MITIVHYIIFLLITIYILLKVIGYGIYEIKQENNKFGGIAFISFSLYNCKRKGASDCYSLTPIVT